MKVSFRRLDLVVDEWVCNRRVISAYGTRYPPGTGREKDFGWPTAYSQMSKLYSNLRREAFLYDYDDFETGICILDQLFAHWLGLCGDDVLWFSRWKGSKTWG